MVCHPKQVAVIGAGISGLATARMLADSGHNAIVYEHEAQPGGLIHCTYENEALFHRVGGHVFNSKNKRVLSWFWRHFDREKEFIKAKRNAAIYLDNKFIPYPIELNLRHLPYPYAEAAIEELAALAKRQRETPEEASSQSFNDFLLNNFGKTLCAIYFLDYNRKIWKTDLSKMSISWLNGKLPMARPLEILTSNIMSRSDSMVHSQFFYPKKGGSQFIANRLASTIDIVHETVYSIEYKKTKIILNNDQHRKFDCIVYTGDLRRIKDLLDLSTLRKKHNLERSLSTVSALRSHGTTTMLCECDSNPYSWVYIPCPSLEAHRIIMTGNFAPSNNPSRMAPGRITCTVEYTGRATELKMKEIVKKLPFSMKPLAYNYRSSTYILHDQDSVALSSRINRELIDIGIYCTGRFAEWKYYNMDAAIGSAMAIVDRINL